MSTPADIATAEELFALVAQLYPICRSITGDGVRQTLRQLGDLVPLVIHEVPSGTQVFDWTVPDEWNIRDAWIRDPAGNTLVDFKQSNLHVVSYSQPVRRRVSNDELQAHLHSLPQHPEWIPYRTSYYARTWGFCVCETQRRTLVEDQYEVCIDADLAPGHLTYGELLLAGERPEEYVFSCHVCHPSLCNDNLSGVAVAAHLARYLADRDRRWSYRFLFAPGTIGALCWLARNPEVWGRVQGGMTLVCLGDREALTYKKSFRGDAAIDRAARLALRDSGQPHQMIDYFPFGYDERQYNAPGFRLAVGSLMRGRHGQFPEYHTSADNLEFVHPDQLLASLKLLVSIIEILESDVGYLNRLPFGEPQLGRRGLYGEVNADPTQQLAMLWLLGCSDGQWTLVDIAERSGMSYPLLQSAAGRLREAGILERLT